MNLRSLLVCALALAVLPFYGQRIAVLSDVHVTPGNKNDSALRAAVAEINATPFDIVVMNGDLTNEGSDQQLANVKAILDGIKHPCVVLPGNHENNWSQSATKTFVDLWGNDRFVTEVGDLVLVGINCGPYMKMGDGHVKQEDLHWLRHTLDAYKGSGKRIVSFNHYPLQDDLDNYIDYIQLLEKYPVILHVNGHYHHWQPYMGGNIPAVMIRALDMKNDDYGYTDIQIDPDWIHIYNKRIGQPRQPKYAYAVNTHIAPMKAPQRPALTSPDGFNITRVWADSASVFTRLGFDAQNVYFGTSTGVIRAIDKHSGTQHWSVQTPASLFSRPVTLAGGNIAVPTCDVILVLDPKGGKTIKSYPSSQGPYVADGLVADNKYLQGAYKRMECRNARSGKLIWQYDSLFNYCQAAPVVDGNDLIFGAWDTNLRCLDLRNGQLRWAWNNGKPANMLGPGNVVPVVTPNRVYIVAPDRYMTAIDRTTGQTVWRNNDHKYRESLGHSADLKRIYAKTMDGELVAVDATTPQFTEIFTIDMGLGYEHAPCIIVEKDGVVYCGSRRGIVTAVDPIAQKVLWSAPVGVSEINGIDIDPTTGDIYVSLIEGTIFRIQKK